MLLCYGQEIAFGCGPGTADSRTNASALFGNLLIGDAGATHLKFIGAVAGKDQVGMGIHEAGRHHSAPCIDDLGVFGQTGFDLATRTHRFDFVSTDEHGSIADDRQLAHFRPYTGAAWAGQRERAVSNGAPLPGRCFHRKEYLVAMHHEGTSEQVVRTICRRLLPRFHIGSNLVIPVPLAWPPLRRLHRPLQAFLSVRKHGVQHPIDAVGRIFKTDCSD